MLSHALKQASGGLCPPTYRLSHCCDCLSDSCLVHVRSLFGCTRLEDYDFFSSECFFLDCFSIFLLLGLVELPGCFCLRMHCLRGTIGVCHQQEGELLGCTGECSLLLVSSACGVRTPGLANGIGRTCKLLESPRLLTPCRRQF